MLGSAGGVSGYSDVTLLKGDASKIDFLAVLAAFAMLNNGALINLMPINVANNEITLHY